MTPTTYNPLIGVRHEFLRHAKCLERCRARYQARGDVDSALKLERALDYVDESVRILNGLIEATGIGEEANG